MYIRTLVLISILFQLIGCIGQSTKKTDVKSGTFSADSLGHTTNNADTSGHIKNLINSDVDYNKLKFATKNTPNVKQAQEYYTKAMNAYDKNNFPDAVNYMTLAIQTDTGYSGAYFMRSLIKFRIDATSSSYIMPDLNKAIALCPDSTSKYMYYFRATYKWEYLHDSAGALMDLTSEINSNPYDINALSQRYVMKREMRDYKGAIKDINALLEIKPDGEIYRNKGILEFLLNDYKSAIKDYSKAIELNIHDTNSYFNRGTSENHLKDYKNAISDFSKTLENNSTYASAYYYRGKDEIIIGEQDAGCEDLHKALLLGIQQAAVELSKSNCSNNVNP